MKLTLATLVVLFTVSLARADSAPLAAPFILQNGGSTEVSILGDPTVGPTLDAKNLGGPYLQFLVFAPAGTVTLTFTVGNLSHTVTYETDGVPAVSGFNIPANFYHPLPASLTVNDHTYDFIYGGSPVPEPVPILLVGTGLIGVGITARRKWASS